VKWNHQNCKREFSGHDQDAMNDLNLSRNQVVRPRAGLFSVLILLAGLLAMASLLRAQNPPTFLFQINSAAVPGAIFYPNFVALDSSNNVYAPDTDNNRVVKLAGNGSYLTQWGTYPNPCSRD
jgi:hypothetical protein